MRLIIHSCVNHNERKFILTTSENKITVPFFRKNIKSKKRKKGKKKFIVFKERLLEGSSSSSSYLKSLCLLFQIILTFIFHYAMLDKKKNDRFKWLLPGPFLSECLEEEKVTQKNVTSCTWETVNVAVIKKFS